MVTQYHYYESVHDHTHNHHVHCNHDEITLHVESVAILRKSG